MIIAGVLSYITAALVSFFLIPLFISLACKFHVIDTPDGIVKNHSSATPYLGGAGVFCGFLVPQLLFMSFSYSFFMILVGSMVFLGLGLLDDFYPMTPFQKIMGQIIASLVYISGGLHFSFSFLPNILNSMCSVIWIILLSNAFNLIDIMDGLATTTSLCCALFLSWVGWYWGDYMFFIMMLSLAGSLSAFLYYNKPQAKIYLGDSGALFLGGVFSLIPFLLKKHNNKSELFLFFILVAVFSVPLLEVLFLIVIRTWKGIPFYKASPHHFALYLRNREWSIKKILIFVGVWSFLVDISFLTMYFLEIPFCFLIMAEIVLVALWGFIVFYLYKTKLKYVAFCKKLLQQCYFYI